MNYQATRWPTHGWVGLVLVTACWILNWSLPGPRTHLLFFPLWLGYCLTVDAAVFKRKGTSMLKRSLAAYIALFLISIPGWWLFELFNLRTQNWFYEGRALFSDVQYVLLTSLSFSTVMPAVFGTAELVSTFAWQKRMRLGPGIAPSKVTLWGFFLSGWVMLAVLLLWPRFFFAFLWLSLFFILEPVNNWLGNRTLLQYTARRDWRPVIALWVGCLICGFFWEMWNYFSYPRWIYQVPFVDFLHVFEMPLPGYLGYLPFSLELFALYHLTVGISENKDTQNFIQVI